MDTDKQLKLEIRELIARWHEERIVEAWDEGFSAGFFCEESVADGMEEWSQSKAKAQLDRLLERL